MITPKWVNTESQPIAVTDVLFYMVAALETPATIGKTLDIGGPGFRHSAISTRFSSLTKARRVMVRLPYTFEWPSRPVALRGKPP